MPTSPTGAKAGSPAPLTPKERSVLFASRVVSVQLQRFIEARGPVTINQLLQAFPEISRKHMRSRMLNFRQRGIVVQEGSCYVPTYQVAPYGDMADKIWKAVRLLLTFRPDQLSQLTGGDREHAASLCRDWCDGGHIVKIGQQGYRTPIYRLISGDVIRPAVPGRKEPT